MRRLLNIIWGLMLLVIFGAITLAAAPFIVIGAVVRIIVVGLVYGYGLMDDFVDHL